jgi:hypothetical protein
VAENFPCAISQVLPAKSVQTYSPLLAALGYSLLGVIVAATTIVFKLAADASGKIHRGAGYMVAQGETQLQKIGQGKA